MEMFYILIWVVVTGKTSHMLSRLEAALANLVNMASK